MDDWKALRLSLRENPDAPLALYNLKDDIGESADVAAEYPEVVRQIRSFMNRRVPSPVETWNFRPRGGDR